jgi:hypothetical protein
MISTTPSILINEFISCSINVSDEDRIWSTRN